MVLPFGTALGLKKSQSRLAATSLPCSRRYPTRDRASIVVAHPYRKGFIQAGLSSRKTRFERTGSPPKPHDLLIRNR